MDSDTSVQSPRTRTHGGGETISDVFVQFFLLVLPLSPDDGALRRIQNI